MRTLTTYVLHLPITKLQLCQTDTCRSQLGHKFLTRELTRSSILHMKHKALRSRVWFRALSRIERGLLDLTIEWVDNVRSTKLAETLGRILTTLHVAMQRTGVRTLQKGRDLARTMSDLACSWGNRAAAWWRSDLNFQMALAAGVLGL